MVWDGLVAVDLFCAGLGAWTLIFTVLASRKRSVSAAGGADGSSSEAASVASSASNGSGEQRLAQFKLVGFVFAFIAVALGALILAVDAKGGLLHPLRYLHLLGNPTSVMMWGVVLISVFLVAVFVGIVLMMLKKPVPAALEWVAVVCGVGVSLYTGILLSVTSAYPLWNPLALPLLFLVSAAYTGYAAAMLIAHLCTRGSFEQPAWFSKAALVLPVCGFVLVVLLVALTAGVSDSSAAAAAATVTGLISGVWAPLFYGGVLVIGLVVPFFLELYAAKMAKTGPVAPWIRLAQWVCILIGGFALRYVVVVAAVPVFA